MHRKAAIGVVNLTERFPSDYMLVVGGKILAEEVRIKLIKDWADHAFNPDYRLARLPEVEQFIRAHHHLPASFLMLPGRQTRGYKNPSAALISIRLTHNDRRR